MDKEILLDKIKLIESEISSLTELLENSDKEEKLPFKIISIFRSIDRIEEYVEAFGNLPRLESGRINYWSIGLKLCEKDGGHAPSMDELAQLASYIYGEEISTYEHKIDLKVKNHIEGLDPSVSGFTLWSSEETSSTSNSSRTRYFGSGSTDGTSYDYRLSDYPRFVCLGDE